MTTLHRISGVKKFQLAAAVSASSISSLAPLVGAQSVTVAPGTSPAGGYLALSAFGVPTFSATDSSLSNLTTPSFTFGGQSWTSLGFASDGLSGHRRR